MKKSLLFFTFVFTFINIFPQDSTVIDVGPGARFHSVKKTSGPFNIKILEIDVSNTNIKVETELARNTLGTGLEKTSNMSKRNNAPGRVVLGAINGDYFGISDPNNPYTFLSNSMIKDTQFTFGRTHIRTSFGVLGQSKPIFDILNFSGTVYAANNTTRAITQINGERLTDMLILYNKYIGPVTKTNEFGTEIKLQPIEDFTINNKIKFIATEKQVGVGNMPIGDSYILSGHGTANSFLNTNINVGDTIEIYIGTQPNKGLITGLMGGGPRLMTNGVRPQSFVGVEGFGESHVNTRHPRTAVGINQDSTRVYFLTVDGRQPALSVGMALWELADYMISIGCHHGVNLDGGGSTVMVVRDNIVNSPSDPGGERSVGNALLAVAEVDVSTILDSFSLSPRQIIIDSTQTRKIDIKGFDIWGYGIEIKPTDIAWQIIGVNGIVDSLGFFIPYNTGNGIIIGTINNIQDTILVSVVGELMPIWSLCAANNTLPSWLSPTGNTERGMAYGFVNNNHRIYVVNRPNITILNAATGDPVGTLNTANCSGGTFVLNDAEVTEDGIIIGANLTTSASSDPFKVYKWDSESSTATSILTYSGANIRLGDKITVVGSFSDNSAVLYAAANSSNKVYKWTMSGGSFNPAPLEITVAGITNTGTNPAVYPLRGGNNNFIINGNSIRPREHTESGAFVKEVPVNLVDSRSNALRYIVSGSKRYLITFQYGTGNENAKVLEVSKGLDSAVLIETTPTLGPNANTTGAAGDIDYRVFAQGVYVYYVLSTNNGIASYLLVNDEIVPVELTSFTAHCETDGIHLNWTTVSETNNRGFEVERKMNTDPNLSIWSTVGFVSGQGTSTEENHYYFIDALSGVKTGNVSYRLKQYDLDGTVTYSQVLTVSLIPNKFELLQNFPNPFNPSTFINFHLPKNCIVSLKVFDILGKEVKNILDHEFKEAGVHQVNFDGSNLASGMYIYKLNAGEFSQIRKMMLLK